MPTLKEIEAKHFARGEFFGHNDLKLDDVSLLIRAVRQQQAIIEAYQDRHSGSTHWPGCEEEHPICAAYRKRDTDVLALLEDDG